MTDNFEKKDKTGYVVTMVVSMLFGVVLVLGTPLFNRFVPESTAPTLNLQAPSTNVGNGGSSY